MKTSSVLTILALIVVVFLFRYIGKKLHQKLFNEADDYADGEPLINPFPIDKEFNVPNETIIDDTEFKVVDTSYYDDTNKDVEIPQDYNDIQNLTEYNVNTYRGTDGRFKSKKSWKKEMV